MSRSYAIYDTATGVIAQIVSTPFPQEVEAILEAGQALRQVAREALPDPDHQRYDRAGNLVPYQRPVDLDALRQEFRYQRNQRLAASDWTQFPDAPVNPTTWQAYRQALRDLPATIDWTGVTSLSDINWPAKPNEQEPE